MIQKRPEMITSDMNWGQCNHKSKSQGGTVVVLGALCSLLERSTNGLLTPCYDRLVREKIRSGRRAEVRKMGDVLSVEDVVFNRRNRETPRGEGEAERRGVVAQ